MAKKRILVVYPEMMVGGSTTSLLAFLNCIDKTKYDVDLQLYKNRGPLLDSIPDGINLLPEAFSCKGKLGELVKKAKFILTGTSLKARKVRKKLGKGGYSGQVMADFQAKYLSRKSKIHYDYAVGFLEGWSDRYIAYCVNADKKYGWLHNTFRNIAEVYELELDWMKRVDKLIFVADNCTEDFCKDMPEMADKADTVYNITDSSLVKARGAVVCENDKDFELFKNSSCFKIITVCRISIYHKGLDRIAWCAKVLKDRGFDFVWMIVGDGVETDKLKSIIEENGVSDRVILAGNRLNPLPFIKEADVFCMPSRYEGKPMVITESMILGVPPVVTEYLSAHEQINNGVDGIVVDNDDFTVVDALVSCMENKDILNKMRECLNTHEYGNSVYMREIEKNFFS